MGVLMVLSSIFLFASYNYLLAGIASTLLFFYPVMVSLIMAVLGAQSLFTGGLTLPQGPMAWVNTIGLGLFPTVISLYLTSKAIELIGSTQTAIFGALEPLTAVVLGIIILGETLTIRPAIGMVMIFIPVTLLVMQKNGKQDGR